MKVKITLITILSLFLFSCAYNTSLVKTSYDILSVSRTTYDTSLKVISDLDSRGLIPRNKRTEILSVSNTFYLAHNASVEALARYEETRSLSDQESLTAQLSLASSALTDLLTLIKPYLEN